MKIQILFICLFCACMAITGCQEESIAPDLISGAYVGVFQISDLKSGTSHTGDVSLNLTEERFLCSENPNRMPAGGAGSFRQKDDYISFEDEHVWPRNFDMHLVLTGKYTYSYDGIELRLWKEVNGTRYEYLLERE